jgi:ElaB/YqjD/DUF883 family membrane-anchored ribosome-binding protein
MDNEDVIRNQMEDTRASLTDKLETLENQVVHSVHDVTTNVAETVEAVKDSVQETVSAVKESMRQSVNAVKGFFDIPYQVNLHPWAMLGGAVVVGYVAGTVLGERAEIRQVSSSERRSPPASTHGHGNGRHEDSAPLSQPSEGLVGQLAPEISKLKGLALGVLMSAARDMIQKSLPPDVGSSLDEILASITEKLSGCPSRAHPSETTHR